MIKRKIEMLAFVLVLNTAVFAGNCIPRNKKTYKKRIKKEISENKSESKNNDQPKEINKLLYVQDSIQNLKKKESDEGKRLTL